MQDTINSQQQQQDLQQQQQQQQDLQPVWHNIPRQYSRRTALWLLPHRLHVWYFVYSGRIVSRQHDECSGSQTVIYSPQYRKTGTDVSKERDYLILTLKTTETPVTVHSAGILKFYQADVMS